MASSPSLDGSIGEANAAWGEASRVPSTLDLATTLAANWRKVAAFTVIAASAAFGLSFVIPPTYTAATTFLPPQRHDAVSASALAALGPLTGLATGVVKTPGDQYVALLRSHNVSDRIIDRFDLIKTYDVDIRLDARLELLRRVDVSLGKKDGLITVTVEDASSARAAEIANSFVDELRRLSSELVLTEAQQRRVFFERVTLEARGRLTDAESALRASGITIGTIKTEPRAAADAFARLKADHTTAMVRLQGLRSQLSDQSVEVRQALATASALKAKLDELARTQSDQELDSGYIEKYREFKYQQALFETLSQQLELARLDEAREGSLVQVVDVATPPERRTRPRRVQLSLIFAALGMAAAVAWVLIADAWRRALRDPTQAERWSAFTTALRR